MAGCSTDTGPTSPPLLRVLSPCILFVFLFSHLAERLKLSPPGIHPTEFQSTNFSAGFNSTNKDLGGGNWIALDFIRKVCSIFLLDLVKSRSRSRSSHPPRIASATVNLPARSIGKSNILTFFPIFSLYEVSEPHVSTVP